MFFVFNLETLLLVIFSLLCIKLLTSLIHLRLPPPPPPPPTKKKNNNKQEGVRNGEKLYLHMHSGVHKLLTGQLL